MRSIARISAAANVSSQSLSRTACLIRMGRRCQRRWQHNHLDVLHRISRLTRSLLRLREMSLARTDAFGYESLIERANSDLASGLGNLSSRTLTMMRATRWRIPSGILTKRAYCRKASGAILTLLRLRLRRARSRSIRAALRQFCFSRALEAPGASWRAWTR